MRSPNFITEIDAVDIHFIYARSKHENALPIIITHGWPYSVLALLKIIEPLTNPTAHGGTASDAFHVVIPSIPGYGYSGKPTATGWGPDRIARAWAVLMNRLGYTRYVAQGGDWGAIITEQMAAQAPRGLIGMHTNMAAVVPPEIDKVLWADSPLPADLSADEKLACDTLAAAYKKIQYALYMRGAPASVVRHRGFTGRPGPRLSRLVGRSIRCGTIHASRRSWRKRRWAGSTRWPLFREAGGERLLGR
jgi:pimeloyl-ACP methyl ester carboxylesterase